MIPRYSSAFINKIVTAGQKAARPLAVMSAGAALAGCSASLYPIAEKRRDGYHSSRAMMQEKLSSLPNGIPPTPEEVIAAEFSLGSKPASCETITPAVGVALGTGVTLGVCSLFPKTTAAAVATYALYTHLTTEKQENSQNKPSLK